MIVAQNRLPQQIAADEHRNPEAQEKADRRSFDEEKRVKKYSEDRGWNWIEEKNRICSPKKIQKATEVPRRRRAITKPASPPQRSRSRSAVRPDKMGEWSVALTKLEGSVFLSGQQVPATRARVPWAKQKPKSATSSRYRQRI